MRQHVKLCILLYRWACVLEVQSIKEMRHLLQLHYLLLRNRSETKCVQILFGIHQPLGANADAPTTSTIMHRKLQCHGISEEQ